MATSVETSGTTTEHEFDLAARTLPSADGFDGAVADGWDMAGVPNGGYLATIALDAMRQTVEDRSPLLVSATYLSAASVGPVTVGTDTLHRGGTHTVVEAVLRQDDREAARVRAVFTGRSRSEPVEYLRAEPPELPDPDECVHPHPDLDVPFPPPAITAKVDMRLRPEHAGFALGSPHGVAEIDGWARFADGRAPDLHALPLFADAFPPAVFNAGLSLSWVPTVELTVHLLAPPVPGWLRARFTTRSVAGSYLEEDGELWDSSGRLVAMSRQLALVPRAATSGTANQPAGDRVS